MSKLKAYTKQLFFDIRFWILIFFIVRLFGITNPPLEGAHNWRQCLTNMIADNFYEIDNNIFFPRIDMAGEKTGIIGTEFPVLNYIIYLFSIVFGQQHWYGRLINLIISSLGVFAFFKSLKLFQNKEIAFYASMILLSSIWFSFSRKIMPDTFSASIVLIGLYFGLKAVTLGKYLNYILFILISAVGVLSKLPSIVLLSVLLIPLLSDNYKIQNKLFISFSGILILVPVYYWYLDWIPYLNEAYGYPLYFPKTFSEASIQLSDNPAKAFSRIYFDSLYSYIGFAVVLLGLYFSFTKKNKILSFSFIIVFALYIVFIFKAGSSFIVNNYYIIPIVPLFAWLGGFAISNFKKPIFKTIIICLIIIEGIINQQHDFFIKSKYKNRLDFVQIANEFCEKDDLILINGGQNPRDLYFLNRKGWTLENQEINEQKLNELKLMNCKYIFIIKDSFIEIADTNYQIIHEDEIFIIYKTKDNEL